MCRKNEKIQRDEHVMSNQTGDDDDQDNNIAPQRCLAYTHIIFVKDEPHTAQCTPHHNNIIFNTHDHYDDYDDDMICLHTFKREKWWVMFTWHYYIGIFIFHLTLQCTIAAANNKAVIIGFKSVVVRSFQRKKKKSCSQWYGLGKHEP